MTLIQLNSDENIFIEALKTLTEYLTIKGLSKKIKVPSILAERFMFVYMVSVCVKTV